MNVRDEHDSLRLLPLHKNVALLDRLSRGLRESLSDRSEHRVERRALRTEDGRLAAVGFGYDTVFGVEFEEGLRFFEQVGVVLDLWPNSTS